jgi:hypothetical protein
LFGCTLSCLKTLFGLSSTPLCHIPLAVWHIKLIIDLICAGQPMENVLNFLSCCLQSVFFSIVCYLLSITFL